MPSYKTLFYIVNNTIYKVEFKIIGMIVNGIYRRAVGDGLTINFVLQSKLELELKLCAWLVAWKTY